MSRKQNESYQAQLVFLSERYGVPEGAMKLVQNVIKDAFWDGYNSRVREEGFDTAEELEVEFA